MTNQKPYDEISDGDKQMLMSYAAHWLSIKPELIGDVNSDKELIERLISFAKVLYEYFPQPEQVSEVGSAKITGA